jgi:hypothetical protein
MATLFDYLSWRGDLSFTLTPFNPVDNVIFSQLSYLPLDGIVPGPQDNNGISLTHAAGLFNEKMLDKASSFQRSIMFKDDPDFISALGSTERFGNCGLRGYVNHIDTVQEKQFCALCIIPAGEYCFIAYRGTDTNFVGWKEDFNMWFNDAIPAQLEAVRYLEKMAGMVEGPLRLGGHSKGGNLAVYAAAFCNEETRRRITDIYSNDAPGFHKHVIKSRGYKEIADRIRSFIPQSSVIGMLLEHGSDYTVVKSSQTGLLQHELYSWEVTHNDMVRAGKVTQGSRFVNKTLGEWISNLDYDQRQQFTEALFTIIGASQAKSVYELTNDRFKAMGRMIQSLGNIDKPTKTLIRKTITALFRSARNNIDTLLKPELEK